MSVRRACVAVLLAASLVFAQEGRARAPDPLELRALADAFDSATGAERDALGRELAAACERAEAALPAGDGELSGAAARTLARAILRAASVYAEQGDTLPLDVRLAFFERAGRAAGHVGLHDSQARLAGVAATVELEAGFPRAARERIEAARVRHPEAVQTLPFLLRVRADAERRLGLLAEALATLDELECRSADGSGGGPLTWRLAGARGTIWLELGLVDVAAREFAREAALLAAAERPDAQDTFAARAHALSLALARSDPATVVAQCDELLAHDAFVARAPVWRAQIEAKRARALAQLVPRDPSTAPAARAALRAAAEAPAQSARERVVLAVRRAELELRAGDLAAAELALGAVDRERATAPYAPELAELDTLRARLALARDTPRAELTALRDALRAHVESQRRVRRALPSRGGGQAWLLPGSRRALVVEWLRLELALEGPAAALDVWLGLEEETALVRRAGLGAATLAELRAEYLAPEQSVVVWCAGPESGLVFTLDAATLDAEPLAGGEEGLRAVLERWRASRDPADARRVRETCFPPRARARLAPGRALTLVGLDVVGDPVLEELPLADGTLLGESLAVDVLPALALGLAWARAAARDTAFDLDLVSVCATRPDPAERSRLGELDDLALSDAQLAELGEPFARVLALHGSAATRAAFLALPLEHARMLAYLGHGALDDERERPAVLVLAEDGAARTRALVDCDAVERLRGPPLVVLAACRSASGPVRAGEGQPAGLPAAWLAAGSRCVVASARDLPLDVARTFVGELNAELARTSDAATAEAVRSVRARHAADPVARAALASIRVIGLGQRATTRTTAHVVAPARREHRPARREHSTWPLLVGSLACAFGAYACARLARRRGTARGRRS